MRQIKFRGKKDYNKEWVYGNLIQFDWANFIVKYGSFEERQRVIPESVGQFTGLTDKNGKEIYEGDIVYCQYKNRHYKIVFENGAFQSKTNELDGFIFTYGRDWIDLEIIGNIHDTPELLSVDRITKTEER